MHCIKHRTQLFTDLSASSSGRSKCRNVITWHRAENKMNTSDVAQISRNVYKLRDGFREFKNMQCIMQEWIISRMITPSVDMGKPCVHDVHATGHGMGQNCWETFKVFHHPSALRLLSQRPAG